MPVFIFGIEAGDETNALSSWSGGEIQDCSRLQANYRPKALEVGNVPTLTRMLAGLKLPAVAVPECTINFGTGPATETVLADFGCGRNARRAGLDAHSEWGGGSFLCAKNEVV